MIITSSNILISSRNFKRLLKANDISINFLDRLPKISEMVLYYQTSLIYNNPDFIIFNRNELKTLEYDNFYNKTYDLTRESIYEVLGNSLHNDLLFLYQIHQLNIEEFLNDNEAESLLPRTLNYEINMNTKNESCILQAVYYVQFYSNPTSILTGFNSISASGNQCRNAGNGVILLG